MPWLRDRLFTHQDQPKPRFAFLGTVNWMRACALLVPPATFSNHALRTTYGAVIRRPPNQQMDTLAFECLTMSAHNVGATRAIATIDGDKYNLCRAGIVSWYYAVYYAAKAMLAAASGSDPQTHTKTARVCHADIVERGSVAYPFNLSVTNIVPSNVQERIGGLLNGNLADLNNRPETAAQAHGALCSYLKGTCEYRQWEIESSVRKSPEFRALGVDNFKTKKARNLRDEKLRPEAVNFLVEAIRYRGKANYRDAIYLSYGDDNTQLLGSFVADLSAVVGAFSVMAAHYVSRRVEAGPWGQFAQDLHEHARFDIPYDFREI